jgi:hypothetical protein
VTLRVRNVGCEITIRDAFQNVLERLNFSLMIIHYACWEGADSFYPIENGNVTDDYPSILDYTV